jgi:hypothetical protein
LQVHPFSNPHIIPFEWILHDDGTHLRRGLREIRASIRRGDFVGRANKRRRQAVSRVLATLLERRDALTGRQLITLGVLMHEIGRHNLEPRS